MAAISASLVKELREMTGAGMMECKKALVEADGDLQAAVDVLRKHGLAAVEKRAGRATNEGAIAEATSADFKAAALVELNCETDFVGINEKFRGIAARIAKAAVESGSQDVESLLEVSENGETVSEIITETIHVMGENTQLTRVAFMEADGVATYIHGAGKMGVMVGFDLTGIDPSSEEFQTYGRDIAMQVAAANPVAVDRASVAPETIEHEMEIYKAQAAESGKPEAIQEKIATGRLEKYYKENCLTEQAFVKDPDSTVGTYTAQCAKAMGGTIAINGFVRFVLGA